ncbi:non-ribosomal peptide synthetase [Amycolatopsis cihanbeyliensis]|nr:non-ribosomal peptide synthetase [Amycolatopsis cihanbeyliensis]
MPNGGKGHVQDVVSQELGPRFPCRDQIGRTGDRTATTHPLERSAVTIIDDLLDVVRRSPNALAVRGGQDSLTYQQLWAHAGAVARALRAAECPVGGYVVLGVPPGWRWTVGLLGIWRAHAVPILSNMEYPTNRLRRIAASTDYVLTATADAAGIWPEHLERVVLPSEMTAVHDDVEVSPGGPPSAACVLHTSGTSGTPKPVVLEHDGLAHRIASLRAIYEIDSADKIAQLAAPSVDVILWETLLAFAAGAQLAIPAGSCRTPGPALARWLAEHDITVMSCTPTMLAALPQVDLPALRLIVLGGERLDAPRHAFWIKRHQVANAYGPTEATIETHVCPRAPLESPTPIGRPVDGVDDLLLDDRRLPVPDGQVGELYLGGVGLAARYDGFPEATAAAFQPVAIDGRIRRLYRTGDLAFRRPDGQLVFVDRADRQLNIGGVRLEPGEVEQAALLLPGVTAALATAEGHERQVLVLHAAVSGADITVADLRTHLAQQLPAPLVPTRIYLHIDLPITDSGKPDMAALKAHNAASTQPTTQAGAANLPDQIARWWTEATGSPPEEGVEFFDGGDSLGAAKLLHQINESFGTTITITEFVADPTPELLSRTLANREDTP